MAERTCDRCGESTGAIRGAIGGKQRHGTAAECITSLRAERATLTARAEAAEARVRAASHLLAVIHRDGGHHTASVGFVQACKDAEASVLILRGDAPDAARAHATDAGGAA